MYSCMLLGRRLVFVTWLIIFSHYYSSIVLVSAMSGFQILYAIAILVLRPFESIKDNLVECLNELFFTSLTLILLKFNTEDNWEGSITDIYVWIMMANNAVLVVVITSAFIIALTQKCIKKCRKKKTQVRPENEVNSVRAFIDKSCRFKKNIRLMIQIM